MVLALRGGERGPSARGHGCQHKLSQVVLAPGLEQHGAVFSLLCSTLLHWDNVRFLILYAEGRKNSTFSFFSFFFLTFLFLHCTYLYAWWCYKARSANTLFQ